MKDLSLLLLAVMLSGCMSEVDLPSSSDLEGGNWYADCEYDGTSYQTRTTSFVAGSYTHVTTHYSDSSCLQKALDLGETGTYTIGGQVPNASRYELDRTLTSLTITPQNSTAVTNYNTSSLCGFSDWAIGVTKNVTGLNCGGDYLPAAGLKYYDVFIIWPYSVPATPGYPGTGITAGTLNFGYTDSTNDGSTPAKRPTSLTSPDYHR